MIVNTSPLACTYTTVPFLDLIFLGWGLRPLLYGFHQEMMEGGELFDYVVQKGTLTEGEASRIVRQVTGAIAYMHSKNFIHRDLKVCPNVSVLAFLVSVLIQSHYFLRGPSSQPFKPENLLLKRTPKGPHDEIDVRIIDFGLSKVSCSSILCRANCFSS